MKSFRHPALGTVTFSYKNFVSAGDSRQWLVVLVPVAGSATEAAVRLLANLGAFGAVRPASPHLGGMAGAFPSTI